jgi:hypothetical protein
MLTYIRSWTGHIGRQPLQDVIFERVSPAGPFPTVSAFHDWFSFPNKLRRGRLQDHPFRSELRDADGEPITFTHGDLHRSNILVSSTGPPKILALIDWHQSGWLPAYWEFCKARWTTNIGEDEWEVKYLPKIVQPYERYDYWDYFVLSLGV